MRAQNNRQEHRWFEVDEMFAFWLDHMHDVQPADIRSDLECVLPQEESKSAAQQQDLFEREGNLDS